MVAVRATAEKPQKLKVLFLSAEAEPFIKVGGLGDVSGALPRALTGLAIEETGSEIEVLLSIPYYAAIKQQAHRVEESVPFRVESRAGLKTGTAYWVSLEGLKVLLIDGEPIASSETVYSQDPGADGEKFTFFSLGALEAVKAAGWQPDILHVNDWHTGMAAYGVSLKRKIDPFFRQVKSVLTVHNLPFLGTGTSRALDKYCLPPLNSAGLPWWAEQLPLPVGLASADWIVPVSPGYAQELLSTTNHTGLEDFLRSRQRRISGIINGIDNQSWNPASDKSIPACFDSTSLARRKINKSSLQEYFGLTVNRDVPLLVFIGRMDLQKGVDIAIQGLRICADLNWQAVILGTGSPALEEEACQLESEYPEQIRVCRRFDGPLARKLYAGADILLMPSRYEPCGLAQMIAMRYGCVPLARRTGGLRDTIRPYPDDKNATGFLFDDPTPASFVIALREMLGVYADKQEWKHLQMNGMDVDFSWHNPAIAYAHIYEQLTEEP